MRSSAERAADLTRETMIFRSMSLKIDLGDPLRRFEIAVANFEMNANGVEEQRPYDSNARGLKTISAFLQGSKYLIFFFFSA